MKLNQNHKPDKELKEYRKNGHFSAREYIPRAYYKGGGRLDRKKTKEIKDGNRFMKSMIFDATGFSKQICVDSLDPRECTTANSDVGRVRGRLQNPAAPVSSKKDH